MKYYIEGRNRKYVLENYCGFFRPKIMACEEGLRIRRLFSVLGGQLDFFIKYKLDPADTRYEIVRL